VSQPAGRDTVGIVDRQAGAGERPQSAPLDPATWAVLLHCPDHRAVQNTANRHVILTKGAKAGRTPASTAYLSRLYCIEPSPRSLAANSSEDLETSWSTGGRGSLAAARFA
jgi:hypothetical protein